MDELSHMDNPPATDGITVAVDTTKLQPVIGDAMLYRGRQYFFLMSLMGSLVADSGRVSGDAIYLLAAIGDSQEVVWADPAEVVL